jgi:PIN domain nuclease of toxin-antitoxin system
LIVVDTHVLLWLAAGEPRLGPRARGTLDRALSDDELAVSAITFWEVAMLIAASRVDVGSGGAAWRSEMLDLGVHEIPLDGEIAVAAVELAGLHGDPADRIIAATAAIQGAVLMTADERLLTWKNPLRRHDARR